MTRKPLLPARFRCRARHARRGRRAALRDRRRTIAFMIDLSSGAVLYAKDADRRMPPASMAKMMTTHVAFDLIKRGELNPDRMCTVRPETWQRWHGPAAGSTMFLSPSEQVSVRNLLHGIVTLSGNDATVVLAECISGTEAAFVALMNRQSRRAGPQPTRNWGNPVGWPDNGVTYTTARDLATLAAATIRDYPAALPRILRHARVHLGPHDGRQPADHPGQSQPAARPRRRRRRPQDRPYRGGRLRLHRLGRAERPAHRHGRRRPQQLQPADRGIGALHGMGLPRLAVAAAAAPGRADRRGAGPARRRRRPSAWSRRATSPSPIRPGSARTSAPGSSIRARSRRRSPQGQHIADLVVADRRHAAAGDAAGRRARGRRGRLLRPHLDGLQEPRSAWRDRPLHHARRRGGGRQVDPG